MKMLFFLVFVVLSGCFFGFKGYERDVNWLFRSFIIVVCIIKLVGFFLGVSNECFDLELVGYKIKLN